MTRTPQEKWTIFSQALTDWENKHPKYTATWRDDFWKSWKKWALTQGVTAEEIEEMERQKLHLRENRRDENEEKSAQKP